MVDACSFPVEATATSPAPNHLFQVDEQCEKLDKDKKEEFHMIMTKHIFLYKRTRPDIHTSVAFLTTRVTQLDQDDWKKMLRLLKYLNGTLDLPLTLSADGNGALIVKWWVDSAFVVHPDMKSQIGTIMSLGLGGVYNSSSKQKLNTKSSTEAELVTATDAISHILWTTYFLTAQGYKTEQSILFQDNKSAILLEQNGILLSGKHTIHINIRYFLIRDCVPSNGIKILLVSYRTDAWQLLYKGSSR